jgi:RNA polymerase sigma-70 factor (ECF subfamily)
MKTNPGAVMTIEDPTVSEARVEGRHDFEHLFVEGGPGVWRTMYAFSGGRRDIAEEAVAEAFARAIAHDRTIRDPLPWIYRTAFRLAREELRQERRRLAPQAGTDVEAPGAVGEVVAALRRLSPKQRAAVVLRYEADLTIEETARRMGVRPATVRVHLHRGRRRLRELLGAEEVDDA